MKTMEQREAEHLAAMKRHGAYRVARACNEAMEGQWDEWRGLFGREPESMADALIMGADLDYLDAQCPGYIEREARAAERELNSMMRRRTPAQAVKRFSQLCS
jgi:methyl coenzyme M reductase subunit D